MAEPLTDEQLALNNRSVMRSHKPFLWDAVVNGRFWILAYKTKEQADIWRHGFEDGYEHGWESHYDC